MENQTIELTQDLKDRVESRIHSVLEKLVAVEVEHGKSDSIKALHDELAAARDDAVEVFDLSVEAAAARAPGDKE
jgi:anti-sigma factor ChrR (cupin superfamily)